MSSAYENAVGGKLRLKGKALAVKTCGISQKIMKKKKHQSIAGGGKNESPIDESEAVKVEAGDKLTAAQRRYLQQWEKIDVQRLNKMATKSHRDRVQEFNEYLANLTEHYDIPKVGPG